MNNEYYGAPSTPNDDFLAHYGIKGMKWGVRKARESGNSKKLSRAYAKAQKHLARLEKRAASGKKYAKRAAVLGAGAAAAGGLAAAGTEGVSKAIVYGGKAFSKGAAGAGSLMTRAGQAMAARGIRGGGRMQAAGQAVSGLSKHNASGIAGKVAEWGKGNSVGKALGKATVGGADAAYKVGVRGVGKKALDAKSKLSGVSNNTYARIGAAGIGAGLAGAAGYNAYRAATAKRNARKAAEYRAAMNKAFAGTQYANGRPVSQKKRRRK